MAWMLPAAIVGSSLLGGSAAESAASTQAAAADRAAHLQKEMFDKQVQLAEPWRKAGEHALNKLIPLTEYTPFSMSQFQQDPGYGFRMSEGMKALERSAAARGGLLSGATLKGIERFGQDLASQEYTNAFNRYQAERQARLQSLAGVGQTNAQQIGAAGQNYASNVGQAGAAAAQARASGYMGGANAISGGLTNYLNYSNQQNQNQFQNALLNRMFPGGGGGGSGIPSMTDFWER